MNLPQVPESICRDAAHSELTIMLLVVALAIIARMYWMEKKKNSVEEDRWITRIEQKLDQSISNHYACQKEMPIKFVSKEEFRDLLAERNRQWGEFNHKFAELISRFWNHSHDEKGKVERQ